MIDRLASVLPWSLKQRLNRLLSAKGYLLFRYATPERARVLDLVGQINREVDLLLHESEACQIVNVVLGTRKIAGDLVEVGVYKGGSAKLIAEFKGERVLHLFDTFEGLPDRERGDAGRFAARQYYGSYDEVRAYLRKFPGVHLYKGYFPDSASPVADRRFSFAHLDVDLYRSTLGCLAFLYPRMTSGGVMITHDYGNAEGVRQAFDEFFADKPEPVLEVALSQALVVKV